MEIQTYNVIGVMSGTSLDGIDLALVEFRKSSQWEFEILAAQTKPYSVEWEKRLQEAMRKKGEDLERLDREYTQYLGGVIKDFIAEHPSGPLEAVCSHGHTVFHQPAKGITLQIGNRPELAAITGERIVCDFRVQDVRLGGQGAPLVPIGDRLLFDEYSYCLNLGGFANVSLSEQNERIAYDICAVNTVMNHYARKLGYAYDEDGKIARQGEVNPGLLSALNTLPFYTLKPPKSLGMEWVEEEIFPMIGNMESDPEKVLSTYTLHVAEILAREFKGAGKILVTGGGAYNNFLIDKLQEMVEAEVIVPGNALVDYKEALIFGLLGVLRLRDEVNCLRSVTGASKDHSSGIIFER